MHITFSNSNNKRTPKHSFVTKTIIMTLAILIVSYIMGSKVHVDNVLVAILASVVISLLNNFIRPILIVLTLPFTLFSMGLFLLVINAAIIIMASKIVPGFSVDGFSTAIIFSLMITILNYLLDIPTKIMNKNKYTEDNPFSNHQKENDDEHFDDYEEVTDNDDTSSKNDNDNNLLN